MLIAAKQERLRQAKAEAEKEIAAYRAEREGAYQKRIQEVAIHKFLAWHTRGDCCVLLRNACYLDRMSFTQDTCCACLTMQSSPGLLCCIGMLPCTAAA